MFSTKGRYAIRFMVDLAEHYSDTPVPLNEISKRQEISKKYLEMIVKILVSENLIKGSSGKGGGYRLLRKPCEYTVGEILELTDGSLHSVACLSPNSDICSRESCCKTLPMWKKYDSMVHDFFYHITIEDLLNGNI